MRLVCNLFFVVLLIIGNAQHHVATEELEDTRDYLNHWVVEIEGGKRYAEEVVTQHGFTIDREFKSLPDHYSVKRNDFPHRSKRSADHHTVKLSEDARVKFVEQQHEKFREKRGHIGLYNRALAGSIARTTGELNDPAYGDMWYINDKNKTHLHMAVKEAWAMGISGKGIAVSILDDGIERQHPDLAENYCSKASYDFNDDDDDPSPRYEITNKNKHGTRCAGEIGMVANNNRCGVGIAYNACIGGLRLLDGRITDHTEGDALGFCSKNIDISSASWGPLDNGKKLEGPGTIAMRGILKSIKEGRNGLGTILVWAAGNGAVNGDNCNCDGYASSIYTLSVSSASQTGQRPWYSEKCASTLAATYSSGSSMEKKVVTVDINGKCTDDHSGTSAAAPMAAAMIALVLEQNPKLTWRDVQHLVVITSKYGPLARTDGWYRNGIGLCVSHSFGFGLMNAADLVRIADPKIWKNVGEQRTCRVKPSENILPLILASGFFIEVEIQTDGCLNQDQEVNFLEHVHLIFNLEYSRRGRIYAELQSPSGTVTPLMFERDIDTSTAGFRDWPLMSVHTWGENPTGTWTFRVADWKDGNESGRLTGVELVLYGTKEKPFYHDLIDNEKCSHLEKMPVTIPTRTLDDVQGRLNELFRKKY